MSKIGHASITIPTGTTVSLDHLTVTVKGSKGELTHDLPRKIKLEIKDDIITITRTNEDKSTKALHGLTRALIANMIEGVTNGFSKTLELVGTGYRAKLEGKKLILALGFSHDIIYLVPTEIKLSLEGNNVIHISGIDKQVVGQVAAVIREYKKPEPYKCKGVRYRVEEVRSKAGKAAKTATA